MAYKGNWRPQWPGDKRTQQTAPHYDIKYVTYRLNKTNTETVLQSFPQRKTLNCLFKMNKSRSACIFQFLSRGKSPKEKSAEQHASVLLLVRHPELFCAFFFSFSKYCRNYFNGKIALCKYMFLWVSTSPPKKTQPCIVTLEIFSTSYLQNFQMKIPKRTCQSSAAMCMAVQLHEKG